MVVNLKNTLGASAVAAGVSAVGMALTVYESLIIAGRIMWRDSARLVDSQYEEDSDEQAPVKAG